MAKKRLRRASKISVPDQVPAGHIRLRLTGAIVPIGRRAPTSKKTPSVRRVDAPTKAKPTALSSEAVIREYPPAPPRQRRRLRRLRLVPPPTMTVLDLEHGRQKLAQAQFVRDQLDSLSD